MTIKIKYADFQIITRSKTLNREIRTLGEIKTIVKELLYDNIKDGESVRLLGISISNLRREEESLPRQLEFDFW